MRLTVRMIQGKICVCEKGTGRLVDVIGAANTPCDGLIRGFYELPVYKDDAIKKIYAAYQLNSALRRAEQQIEDGISPEIALFAFKKLFTRERVSV